MAQHPIDLAALIDGLIVLATFVALFVYWSRGRLMSYFDAYRNSAEKQRSIAMQLIGMRQGRTFDHLA